MSHPPNICQICCPPFSLSPHLSWNMGEYIVPHGGATISSIITKTFVVDLMLVEVAMEVPPNLGRPLRYHSYRHSHFPGLPCLP